MMKAIKYLSMAVLALVGAAITGCSSDEDLESKNITPEPATVTLTTTISLDDAATTRALTSEGVKTFAEGETMALVYKNTSGETVKAVSAALPAGDYDKSATFTFELTNPDKDQNITYIYPATMAKDNGDINYDALATQDGTLDNLASNLDLATYTGAWDGTSLPSATLDNQLAILAITLKDEAGSSPITSGLTKVTVSDGTNSYTVAPTGSNFGSSVIYVAIRPTSSANIEVSATDGTNIYAKSLTDKTYEINNGYNVSWRMTNMLQTPLTLEATADNTTITFTNVVDYAVTYTVNGGSEGTIEPDDAKEISVNAGDKVCFYGDNEAYAVGTNSGSYSTIQCSADCYIYGNIMSLVSSTGYAVTWQLNDMAFYQLFYNNVHIVNHPSKALVLPATTLSDSCYKGMFYGCTGLTTAPALPAEELEPDCYAQMFQDCTGLTTAPALPAEAMTPNCYDQMFKGCTGLTTAPALPATQLMERCYSQMFEGCTSLTTAPALPAEQLASYCYSYMFRDCTSLTTAPALPAEKLVDYCYYHMFYNCSNMTSVTCLATWGINSKSSTTDWLFGVAATGTFTKNANAGTNANPYANEWEWPISRFGIPSGWTIVNAQ